MGLRNVLNYKDAELAGLKFAKVKKSNRFGSKTGISNEKGGQYDYKIFISRLTWQKHLANDIIIYMPFSSYTAI